MRVLLLANYRPDDQQSMQRYAGMLHDLLTAQGWQAETIRPEPFFGRLKTSGRGLGKWLGYLDKFVLFPLTLRRVLRDRKAKGEKVIVHICDHSNAMYTRWLRDVPHVVTCHDVLAIQSALGLIPNRRTGWTGRILQRWILSSLRRAARVVLVSEATRRDLLALAPELAGRSVKVENGLNYPYTPMPPAKARREILSIPVEVPVQPFVFHVGGNHWYKNRVGVIRIFGRLMEQSNGDPPLTLVMAGQAPTDEMRRAVIEERMDGRVVFLTDITDAQLCALYSLAEALIYPSWREGFGWPIVEAQACGCPVVTSDLAPMNEIAGPAALLADPKDETAFATCVAELLAEGPELGRRRQSEAIRHAGNYDSSTFLRRMLEVYESLLK